jgi:hypothetical protein
MRLRPSSLHRRVFSKRRDRLFQMQPFADDAVVNAVLNVLAGELLELALLGKLIQRGSGNNAGKV